MPNRSRQRCPSWQRAPFETGQSEHSYRPRSHTPCRNAYAFSPPNPGAPITSHHVPPSSPPPTSGMGRAYKRASISRFSFYIRASPSARGLDSGNAPASDTKWESISRVSVFTSQSPPRHTTANLRTRSYYQQTKDLISGGLSSILAYI